MMETISQMLLTFLLNAAWQIILITIIASCCDQILKKASARIRHILWIVTLIFSLGLPIYTGLSTSDNLFFESQPAQKAEIQVLSNIDLDSMPLEASPQPANSTILVNKNLSIFICTLYFLFLIYQLAKFLLVWRKTQFLRRGAFTIEAADFSQTVFEECQDALFVEKATLLYSADISAPVTMGAFNPLVLLPEKLSEETDRNILLAAIGHELVHVKRRDYLLNLLYQCLYLPLSFHPAVRLVKRRINETRELSCDELVTDKFLDPHTYAGSLVQLAGSAINLSRKANITIGINDADILENRIMRILRRPKITTYHKSFLLTSALLLLLSAFIMTTAFTLRPVIAQQTSDSQEEKLKAEKDAQLKEGYKTIYDNQQENILLKKKKLEQELLAKPSAEQDLSASQVELAKQSKITMAEAISIASKRQPGTVLECKLVFVKTGQSDELYYVVKIAGQEKEKDTKTILINANTGIASTPKYIVKTDMEIIPDSKNDTVTVPDSKKQP